MNKRILKKMSKRAMATLKAEHGYRDCDFVPSDGEETIDVARSWPRHQQENGFACPLKGTSMVITKVSTMYDEWGCDTAHHVLSEIEYWQSITPEEWREMAAA